MSFGRFRKRNTPINDAGGRIPARSTAPTGANWDTHYLPVGRVRERNTDLRTNNRHTHYFPFGRFRKIRATHYPVEWWVSLNFFSITVRIGFAFHWIIFSWTIGHPVGFVHLAMRILFVLAAWHLFPVNRMGAVSTGIALAYAISLVQLCTINWPQRLGLKKDPRWA